MRNGLTIRTSKPRSRRWWSWSAISSGVPLTTRSLIARAHRAVRERIAGVGEHAGVERSGGGVAELLSSFAVDLVPIRGDHHRNVDHQPRSVPARAVGSFLQGGHGDLLDVGRGAIPAHGTIGKAPRDPECWSAQCGYRYRSAGGMREAGVRSIELALEMPGPVFSAGCTMWRYSIRRRRRRRNRCGRRRPSSARGRCRCRGRSGRERALPAREPG